MNELHFPVVSLARRRSDGLQPAAGRDGVLRESVSPTLRGILAESRYQSDPAAVAAAAAARPDYEPDGPPVGTSKRKVPIPPAQKRSGGAGCNRQTDRQMGSICRKIETDRDAEEQGKRARREGG
jgi:hypothetical protein